MVLEVLTGLEKCLEVDFSVFRPRPCHRLELSLSLLLTWRHSKQPAATVTALIFS